MSRFARTTQEAFLRRKELKEKDKRQGYQETFLLYQIILLHSWETGVCNKRFGELCEIYDLEYHNSYRRLKILRTRGWVTNEGEYIRPLIIRQKDNKQGVKITPTECKNYTNEGVKITPNECKNYTNEEENGVIFTPENHETADLSSSYGDPRFNIDLKQDCLETTTTEKAGVVVVDKNGHKSQFSIEECLQYAEFCKTDGQEVRNIYGLAITLFESGEADAFIKAKLYPENNSRSITSPDSALLSDVRRKGLEILSEMSAIGDDITDYKNFYTQEDWVWLMENLENNDGEN